MLIVQANFSALKNPWWFNYRKENFTSFLLFFVGMKDQSSFSIYCTVLQCLILKIAVELLTLVLHTQNKINS